MKAIIIGLGIAGSAAAYSLARRGVDVVAFDAQKRGHNFGSSHGTTRMTRLSYFESPHYVPLLRRSLELWRELESESGRTLTALRGGLYCGLETSAIVSGALRSAREHGIKHELLSAAQVGKRFAMFKLPGNFVALFEPSSAGVIFADKMLETYQDLAISKGAVLHFENQAIDWRTTAGGASITTSGGTADADVLVITAGPWMPQVLSRQNLPLSVTRVWSSYFEPVNSAEFAPDRMPVYMIEDSDGEFYGFPYEQGKGMKLGCYHSKALSSNDYSVPTPENCDRSVSDAEIGLMGAKLNAYLPGSAMKHMSSSTCLFTVTPDGHFIVDAIQGAPQVVYASACSGHGFKFGSVVGEILADLAIDGKTRQPIEFLSAKRFSSTVADAALTSQ